MVNITTLVLDLIDLVKLTDFVGIVIFHNYDHNFDQIYLIIIVKVEKNYF